MMGTFDIFFTALLGPEGDLVTQIVVVAYDPETATLPALGHWENDNFQTWVTLWPSLPPLTPHEIPGCPGRSFSRP